MGAIYLPSLYLNDYDRDLLIIEKIKTEQLG